MRALRDERGGVLVLASVMIPVFLLLTAVVIDVGNWYTHKRQLQNRADAAALAAAIEYGQNWKACVYEGSDPAKVANKALIAQKIANAARQYAADPEAADYALLDPSGAIPASLYNDQIARQDANQANNYLDVVVNSSNNDYTDDTDYTDDYDGNVATRNGTPCFVHPSDPEGLSAPGHWLDVKVTERDTAALWEPFSPDIHARARVEIRPALSGHRFLPLAIPDNVVTQVQVRYFDGCTGAELAKANLAKLPASDYAAYSSAGGGSLWGVKSPGSTPPVGDKNLSIALPLNGYDPVDCGPSGLQFRPIVEQVRLASSPDVNLDRPCSELQDLSFADCFSQLSEIRVWNTGAASSQPRIQGVRANGGCPAPSDPYFGTLAIGTVGCPYPVSVEVNWGTRDDGLLNDEANFTVTANGTTLPEVSEAFGVTTYSSTGTAFTGSAGRNAVTISIAWEDNNPSHTWNGSPCVDPPGPAKSPCRWDTSTEVAHHVVIGKNSTNTKPGSGYDPAATGAVEFVHTSLSPVDATGAPGGVFDNWNPGFSGCAASPCQVYPTVGIRSALVSGKLVTLRTDTSQGSQLLACDPAVPNGKELLNFRTGCAPWYGPNSFTTGNWWDQTTQLCPDSGLWYRLPAAQSNPYVNSASNWWECVLQSPGVSAGQAGDWMAVATDNCNTINPAETQCQNFKNKTDPTVNCGDYDGIDSDGDGTEDTPGWIATGDSEDPRIVSLFIVPYQAFKNVGGSGSSDEIPILRFASFYVMAWKGQNAASDDPCPDPTFGGVAVSPPDKATVIGVFDAAVSYETGPVDPNATCREDDPTPCRAVLVR